MTEQEMVRFNLWLFNVIEYYFGEARDALRQQTLPKGDISDRSYKREELDCKDL